MTRFPAVEALVQLGDGVLRAWSPDGRWLLYSDDGAWYASDMSGAAPGTKNLLVDPPLGPGIGLNPLAWAADSKSVAVASGTTLWVTDPTQDAPPLNPLTSTVQSYRWAPAGTKLLYVDATGSHVVDVIEGVPGAPQLVEPAAGHWSPTGLALAGEEGGNLVYTSLAGPTPSFGALTAATTQNPGVEGIVFNAVGSRVAITGWLDREEPDAWYVNLLPTPGEAIRAHGPLPPTVRAHPVSFSPDGDWLVYRVYDYEETFDEWRAVNVAGAGPGTFVSLGSGELADFSWLPTGLTFIARDYTSSPSALVRFEIVSSPSSRSLLSGVAFSDFAINSAGTQLGYATTLAVHVLDLSAPGQPGLDIQLTGSGAVSDWHWSPDSEFIAAAVKRGSSWQQRLVRIDGPTASTVIDLGEASQNSISSSWQPI